MVGNRTCLYLRASLGHSLQLLVIPIASRTVSPSRAQQHNRVIDVFGPLPSACCLLGHLTEPGAPGGDGGIEQLALCQRPHTVHPKVGS